MNEPIVIIGIGELASVFARGFLRCGHPVYINYTRYEIYLKNIKKLLYPN